MKSSELGAFWMREKIDDLRRCATGARRAYKSKFMTSQTFAYAAACDEAATVMERHLSELEKAGPGECEHGRRDGVGGG